MLERYYVRPKSCDRIRALWLGPAIARYAEWLVERQMNKLTALSHLRRLVDFNRFVLKRGAKTWDELPGHVDAFVKAFVACRLRKHRRWSRTVGEHPGLIRSHARVPVEHLLRLIIPGYLGTVRRHPWPLQTVVPGFLEHLRDERGLRRDTLRRYEHHLRVFERFLKSSKITDFSKLTPSILNKFVLQSTARISAQGRMGRAGVLRVLLRFMHRQGLIGSDLSRSIPRGRSYRCAAMPRSIPWSDVQRVIASVDRRSPLGKRDYAMLMLLATYGLRSQEVAALELSAIDWSRSQLHILGRKAGNSTTYPLAASVGEAIIDYLRNARPTCADRHVFVSIRAPYHGLDHTAASRAAGSWLTRAGIKIRRPGSHTFRHSCAQRLVEADIPFKHIGDYIGHCSSWSTQVYAKVAIHKLRELIRGDAEEAL